jgi:SWI/SNF-related matrix-associated actin-dependent regulator of chromatin subfamily A member 5
LQSEDATRNAEVGKRERAKLREMQKLKKQKIQQILDSQNATIDADMVCSVLLFVLPLR